MAILHAIGFKPFDLEPVYKTWLDAPKFRGNEVKDGKVDIWLNTIKQGCKERGIPKDLWPVVAQNYMSGKATQRLEDVKKVMTQMYGEQWSWNWKRFKAAMLNMNCRLCLPCTCNIADVSCRGQRQLVIYTTAKFPISLLQEGGAGGRNTSAKDDIFDVLDQIRSQAVRVMRRCAKVSAEF